VKFRSQCLKKEIHPALTFNYANDKMTLFPLVHFPSSNANEAEEPSVYAEIVGPLQVKTITHGWKLRWCVFQHPRKFCIFSNEYVDTLEEIGETFDLKGASAIEIVDTTSTHKWTFQLQKGKEILFQFCANSEEDRTAWIQCFQSGLQIIQ